MKNIREQGWLDFIDGSGIRMADPNGPTGAELGYLDGPIRILEIHFADTDFPDKLIQTLDALFSVQTGWFLFRRFGEFPVQFYEENELPILKKYLVDELGNITNIGEDLYLVGKTGDVYFFYDHHFTDQGLGIFTKKIEIAKELLILLNEIGSELELFSPQEP